MPPSIQINLSIVIPFYNEEDSALPLLAEINEVMSNQNLSYEVIAINDGSTDNTAQKLEEGLERYPLLQVLTLARNYGQTSSLAAGFDMARGEMILPMDGDGQNDPHDIPLFVNALSPELDLISGWRRNRKERSLRRTLPSKIANFLVRRFSGIRIHDFGCTMKLYRREQLKQVHLYGEMHRFIPIFVQQEGGQIAEIEVNHRERSAGVSKYGLERVFKVIADLMVIVFFVKVRDKPIYLFGSIGLIEIGLGCMAMLWAIYRWMTIPKEYFFQTPLPNLGMFLGVLGILTILLGLLADLTMRTYYESQGKQTYRIKKNSADT